MITEQPPYRLIQEPSTPALSARGSSFVDPNFDTTLVRVTDETDGKFCQVSYGIWPIFSLDYDKILVQCDGRAKVITWNPSTMSDWGKIDLPSNFQGVDASWSHVNPDSIYHRDGGSRLMCLNVKTGVDSVVHDFAADFPDSPYIARMSVGADDSIFCFARQTTDYKFSGFCVFDRNAKSLYSEPPSRKGQYFKVQIDKSGRYVWNVSLDPLSEWWDLSFHNTQRTLTTKGTGHSAVLTSKIAQYNPNTNYDDLKSFGAESGVVTIKWPDWTIATEYSGTDADERWYAVTAGSLVPVGPLHDELLQVSTDGSGTVRRLCHMHNVMVDGDYDSIPKPAQGYGRQPWIGFHSSWGKSGRRDVFLAKVDVVPSNPTKPLIRGVNPLVFLELYGALSGRVVTATIGGLSATVTYAGDSQVNVFVPPALVGKGKTDVILTIDGVATESVYAVV